jgi:hypothetical protein
MPLWEILAEIVPGGCYNCFDFVLSFKLGETYGLDYICCVVGR